MILKVVFEFLEYFLAHKKMLEGYNKSMLDMCYLQRKYKWLDFRASHFTLDIIFWKFCQI